MAPDLEDGPAAEEAVATVDPPWPEAVFPSSTPPADADAALPVAPLLFDPFPELLPATVPLADAPTVACADAAEN